MSEVKTLLLEASKDRKELVVVAAHFGVPVGAFYSSEEHDIYIFDGFICLRSRLIDSIRSGAQASLKKHGFIDIDTLSRELELNPVTSAPLIESVLKDIDYKTRKEYEQSAEQVKITTALLAAKDEPVIIPVDMKQFVADLVKRDERLRGGCLVDSGSVYHPLGLRQKKSKEILTRLSDGEFVQEEGLKLLLPEDCKATDILHVPNTNYGVQRTILETIHSLVQVELSDAGCCSLQTISDIVKSRNLGTQNPLEDQVADAIGRSLVDLQLGKPENGWKLVSLSEYLDDTFLVSKSAFEDFVYSTSPTSFTRNTKLNEYLNELKQGMLFETKQDEETESIIPDEMSKRDIEHLFTTNVWPEFQIFSQSVKTFKRTPIGPLLEHFLVSEKYKSQFLKIFEALLRRELQLTSTASIPKEKLHEYLGDFLETTLTNVETLQRAITTTATNKFGLPCIGLDKKKEKELISQFKAKWQRKSSNAKTRWLNLLKLITLNVYKEVIYVEGDDEDGPSRLDQLFQGLTAIISLKDIDDGEFITWSTERLRRQDWNESGANLKYIDQLYDQLEEILKTCKKIKPSTSS